MKKFLFLLCSLLTTVGAWAMTTVTSYNLTQVTGSEGLADGKLYVVRVNGGSYITEAESQYVAPNGQNVVTPEAIFRFQTADEGATWTVLNETTGNYWGTLTEASTTSFAPATQPEAGSWTFTFDGNNVNAAAGGFYINRSSGVMHGWGTAISLQIYEVTGTVIRNVATSLSDLNNSKAYLISTERGSLGVSDGQLVATSKAGFEASNFALVQYNEVYYLYSVAAKSFVNAEGTVTNESPVAITISELGDNLFQFFFGENCINVSAGYDPGLVINSWTTLDAGNRYTIAEVADFDPFAPLAILDPSTAEAKNLDFSETAPMDNGICTYDKDMATNSTTYSGPQPVDKWNITANGAITNGKYDQVAAGVYAYGGTPFLGGAGYLAPPTNPEGDVSGNALGLVAVWTGSVQYTQQVLLPAGNYKLTIPVYNSKGGDNVPVKSLIGFVADDGTEYLAPAKAYPVNVWTNEVITFSLDEPTTGYYTLGYQGQNVGSGSAQHLFFDGIYVQTVDDSEAIRTQLTSLLATAQATVEAAANVGDELFQKPTEAFNAYAAVVEAQQAVADNAEATVLELQAAVDALTEAAATYAAAVNAPKDYATYTFRQKASGLYLTLDVENDKVVLAEEPQEFTFEVAEGGFYVKNEEGYVGLAGSNAWTMSTAEDKKLVINPVLVAAEIPEVAQAVSDHQLEGGMLFYYTLNEKNGLIGTDATDAGAACYANKAQNDNSLWTITENAPERFEYGKYIVQNVATGKYWGAGNSWGTQGTMGETGIDFVITANGEGYTLDSGINNGGANEYLGPDLYLDNTSTTWFITPSGIADGKTTYTASVVGPDGKTYTTTTSDVPTGDGAKLMLYVGLMAVSAAAAFVLLRSYKKKENRG